jgi:hypothetical protein
MMEMGQEAFLSEHPSFELGFQHTDGHVDLLSPSHFNKAYMP